MKKLHKKDVENIHSIMEKKGYTNHLYGCILGADIVDGDFQTSVIGESKLWYRVSDNTGAVTVLLSEFNAENIPTIATRSNMEQTTTKKFPVQVTGDRIMVLPLMEEDEISIVVDANGISSYQRQGSILSIPKSEYEEYRMKKQNTLAKCMIMSIGEGVLAQSLTVNSRYKEGDIVYCFPTTQDAKMTIDGIEYWVYKEKSIVAKEI